MRATAKVHRTNTHQTLDLPDGFELSADEVWVRRDEVSGDIILTPKPSRPRPERLARLFALLDAAPLPEDLLQERENPPRVPRDPFDDRPL
ncbi:MAG: AbrB family transcriptional regulator [Thiohalocapsa sp.]|uniref:antitoxin n=1 Tax=Thiohalocapsa sp. TaxID=2497641 RepID=UPI0025CC616D|nr:AbrB family transcriptional regulator [Thiohalocapsa sp.]MCG6940675.1 AbrB family transcriptional regulator [Thiohalocapsa sp.]